jgi:hypothetical protein
MQNREPTGITASMALSNVTRRCPRVCVWIDQELEINLHRRVIPGTSETTVKIQRHQVMEKMGAGSVAELVRMADRLGVATPSSTRL